MQGLALGLGSTIIWFALLGASCWLGVQASRRTGRWWFGAIVFALCFFGIGTLFAVWGLPTPNPGDDS